MGLTCAQGSFLSPYVIARVSYVPSGRINRYTRRRVRRPGSFEGGLCSMVAGGNCRGDYQPMWAIIASANSEHFTFFASVSPSAFIRRSKSYVTVRAVIAPFMPLIMRSAAAIQPI